MAKNKFSDTALAITLKTAISTRDSDEYEVCIKTLRSHETSKEWIEALLLDPLTRSVFYRNTGPSYVGLNRNICYLTSRLVNLYFPERLPVIKFLSGLLELDTKLCDLSLSTFNEYQEEAGLLLCDSRLNKVIEEYEKSVVERFVENYLKGVSGFSIVSADLEKDEQVDKDNDKVWPKCVVKSNKEGTTYTIVDWQCTCNELVKTGISCAHVILQAISNPSKAYSELISWKLHKERISLEK